MMINLHTEQKEEQEEEYFCVNCGCSIDKEEYQRNNGYCEVCIMEEEELEEW